MSTTPPPPPPPPGSPPPPPPPGSSTAGTALVSAEPSIPPAWKRIVARLLDSLILGLVFAAVFASVVLGDDAASGVGGIRTDASFAELYAIAVFGAVVGFVWDAVCTKQFGGTPMKLAFGMRVVQAETGAPVEWRHAIIRWAIPGAIGLLPLGQLASVANLVIVVVSLVFLFTKPRRQAVWDLAAKTVVVNR